MVKRDRPPQRLDRRTILRRLSDAIARHKYPHNDHKKVLDDHREGILIMLRDFVSPISHIAERLRCSDSGSNVSESALRRYIASDQELTAIIQDQIAKDLRPGYRKRRRKIDVDNDPGSYT